MDKLSNHKQGREQGFTLIELLVSISLMALILGILATGISVVAKGWDKNAAQISTQDMFSRGYGQLRSDIRGLQRQIWHRETIAEFMFQGLEDGLKFVVIEPPYPTRPGPYVVSFFVKKNGTNNILMRARTPYHPDIQDFASLDMRDEVPLFDGPYKYRFSYGAARSNSHNWFKSWPNNSRLPGLIKLEIIDIKSGQPIFAPLITRTRIDAEPGCLERAVIECTTRTSGVLNADANNRRSGQ